MSQLVADIAKLLESYSKIRTLRTGAEKQEDTFKGVLLKALEELPTDESGHSTYMLPEPLEGWDGKPVWGAKREKRVSQSMDQDAALALVEKYGLRDSCIETVEVLNEDGLLAANFSGVIPDDEFKSLYSDKVSYAFVPVRSY